MLLTVSTETPDPGPTRRDSLSQPRVKASVLFFKVFIRRVKLLLFC